MDYFSFIVHVFSPQTREFYSLERLWGDAERIDVSDEPARRPTSPPESSSSAASPTASIAILIAPGCAACAAPLDQPTLGPVCARAGAPSSRSPRPSARNAAIHWRRGGARAPPERCPRCRRCIAIARARAVGAYDGSLRAILHALKFGKRQSLGDRSAGS